MKKRNLFAVASLFFITAAQGSVLQIDFSTLAGTQSGWEAINGTGSPSGTFSGYTDLAAGNITVSLANIAYNRRYDNGGANDNFPGTDLDAMYGDLLFRNNDSATVDVTIGGLLEGTYQITTHHLIDSPNPGQFDLNVQDADSPGFGQFVGNFTLGTGNTSSFNPTDVSFDVVSNGTDDIILQMDATTLSSGGNTGGWFGYNGLEIDLLEEVLRVDVDSTYSGAPLETQTGWESLHAASGDGSELYTTLFGDVTVTIDGSGDRNRGDITGDPLSDVNEDFSFVDGSGAQMTVTLAGLDPGLYEITSFHYDSGAGGLNESLFDLTVTDATGTTKVLDAVPWDLGGHTYTVRSDGSPVTLTIDEAGIDSTFRTRFNGLIVTPIPEPASLALLAMSGVLFLNRHGIRTTRAS